MNGNLTLLGSEHFTLNANDIAHIEFLEICVELFTEAVTCHIALDVARKILHIAEGCLTHDTLRHQTACDGYLLSFHFLEMVLDICAVMSHIIFGDLEGILSR